ERPARWDAHERQRHVERAEDAHEEEDAAHPRPRMHDRAIPRIERRQQHQPEQHEEEHRVARRERRARPVRGQQEEQDAVAERLDRVVDASHYQARHPPLRALERPPHLHDEHEEQPQQQDVTDDPADVAQLPTEDEEREQAADERREGDAPSAEEGGESAYLDDVRASAIRRATSSRRSAAMHSRRSLASAWPARRATTRSSAIERTGPSSAQISRRTRAMETSRAATSRMTSTYSRFTSLWLPAADRDPA